MRVTLIAAHGAVLSDSDDSPNRLGNQLDQPEVRQALASGSGWARRVSQPSGGQVLYYALAQTTQDAPARVVRVARPLAPVQAQINVVRRWAWGAAALSALVVWSACWLFSVWLAKPIDELTSTADEIAAGGFHTPVMIHSPAELSRLARSFNQMRLELATEIGQLRQSRERLAIVLGSMIEGVLAVDANQRILFANNAARALLEFATPETTGRPLLEAVRNRAVQQAVHDAFAEAESTVSEFEVGTTTRAWCRFTRGACRAGLALAYCW